LGAKDKPSRYEEEGVVNDLETQSLEPISERPAPPHCAGAAELLGNDHVPILLRGDPYLVKG